MLLCEEHWVWGNKVSGGGGDLDRAERNGCQATITMTVNEEAVEGSCLCMGLHSRASL